VGLAGGIATPESAAAAFAMGAAYILTGSINQSCVEAGISQEVKQLLCQVEQADVAMAPAADMFEIGARVQVLKRGTLFALRAEKTVSVIPDL
jgi:trans-AT polyketide synthase, acyltransferase and oxidoreductase domains